ncbi:MAG: hypothetical protein ACTHMW_09280 [Actinomycetes bacterium]
MQAGGFHRRESRLLLPLVKQGHEGTRWREQVRQLWQYGPQRVEAVVPTGNRQQRLRSGEVARTPFELVVGHVRQVGDHELQPARPRRRQMVQPIAPPRLEAVARAVDRRARYGDRVAVDGENAGAV